MKFPVAARFVERANSARVNGEIHRATWLDIAAQSQWDYEENALDREWDWAGIFAITQRSRSSIECYAAVVGEELHGLMAIEAKGRKIGRSEALVLEYLATNPRNRTGGLKYVGVTLLAVAVARSKELGMAGRIWLESLADAKTLMFYRGIGMTEQTAKSDENYDVFTFDVDSAEEFFKLAQAQSWITL